MIQSLIIECHTECTLFSLSFILFCASTHKIELFKESSACLVMHQVKSLMLLCCCCFFDMRHEQIKSIFDIVEHMNLSEWARRLFELNTQRLSHNNTQYVCSSEQDKWFEMDLRRKEQRTIYMLCGYLSVQVKIENSSKTLFNVSVTYMYRKARCGWKCRRNNLNAYSFSNKIALFSREK